MEKAYDLKALGEKLKQKGLIELAEGAEETAKQAYLAIKEWVQESAPISENKIDDVIAPFFGHLDPIVLPVIDKINPADNA